MVPRRHGWRSEEHTSELQSHHDLVCRLLLEKKNAPRPARCGLGRPAVSWPVPGGAAAGQSHGYHFTMTRPGPHSWPAGQRSGYFFFNDTATTEIYTLSLHDALPI